MSEACPVCGDDYVHYREIEPRGTRGSVTGVDTIAVREDYTACRETRTELKGGHGNWKKAKVQHVYIHQPTENGAFGEQEGIDANE